MYIIHAQMNKSYPIILNPHDSSNINFVVCHTDQESLTKIIGNGDFVNRLITEIKTLNNIQWHWKQAVTRSAFRLWMYELFRV